MPGVKFAVVREDPHVEAAVVRRVRPRKALLVASGGCTAFALAHEFPDLEVDLYDFNPAQIAHVAARAEAIAQGDLARLNVGDADPQGLSQCGDFERLFRLLRQAVIELVAPVEVVEAWFAGRGRIEPWLESPYWGAAFEAVFTDALLVAMFGPDAVQHAPKGSYPAYFRDAFAAGLRRPGARHNPFLQHVFLGRYLPKDAPPFLRSGHRFAFRSVLGGIPDVADLGSYGLVHLSNIFDWQGDDDVRTWCEALRALPAGAAITIRQLNNQRDVERFLSPWFAFDPGFARSLLAADRSLFYERLLVGSRTEVA